MSKATIEKQEFYPTLIGLMQEAKRSIHFYTISGCFGFYSRGLSTFENVVLTIRDGLSRITSRRYLDVRVLVKIDHENPIDVYAANCLAQLESRFVHTGDREDGRNIFRRLSS